MRLYKITNFLALASIKLLAMAFYRIEHTWLDGGSNKDSWKNLKLIVFLNHTSLFEPLFLGAVPLSVMWRIAGNIIAPGADITLDRPFAGFIYRYMMPQIVSISRERDDTWDKFMNAIEPESVVIIAPEGRMKRVDGLDKHGNPMSVRGGIADILEMLPDGDMVIAYSGGLHHVQIPGQGFPKLFKRIKVQTEKLNIQEYIAEMRAVPDSKFKVAVTSDLNERLKRNVPAND